MYTDIRKVESLNLISAINNIKIYPSVKMFKAIYPHIYQAKI